MRAITLPSTIQMWFDGHYAEKFREYDKQLLLMKLVRYDVVVEQMDTIEKNNHTVKQWEDDIRQFQYLSYAPIVFVCLN